MTIMGNGGDIFRRAFHRWLEAIDGDFAFRLMVMTAGMLSTVAFAFGLLSL
ncbi:hypothetical protein V5279_39925 [Bradyrhizobium sp. 26S5]|jgi:hypothetical protein|uniref:hypothetical protein n=1 Tax=Bradyrhizobium sp. 26S5 TaxID=3139729 RepID=UPI0030D066BF